MKNIILLLTLVLSLLNSSTPASAATTSSVFTGGDPGEGLDLQGTFVYAFNVGTPGAAGKAGDADFTADDAPGITVTAINQIASWHAPEYGDSPNDDVIEIVMQSIRWSPAPEKPTVALTRLVPGATYKIQLLFAEQCCAGRGFDVLLNDQLIADEFNPAGIQGGAGVTTQGVVLTHDYVALSDNLTIVLDGTTVTSPEFNDRNPILSGVTVEQLGAPGDSDNDTLADAWEQQHFQGLTQTAAADPDQDGLTNKEELTAGSDPNQADTDKDGLSDSAEFKTHGTDPKRADTDSDGLTDADEVNTHGTNPKLADTDSDGLRDSDEVNRTLSNPKLADTDGDGFSDLLEFYGRTSATNKNHFPRGVIVGRFTGGDAGEGLDLDGTFTYAVNIGSPGAAGKVRDADFTADDSSGVVVSAGNEIAAWHAPTYGTTDNDNALEKVMQSIRWSNAASADQPSVNVDLSNLTIGRRYKLQLLFAEQCCANRAFDIFVEERQVADEYNPAAIQGNAGNRTAAAYISIEFTAKDDTANIVLDGRTVTTPRFTDHNAILSGLTLELLNLGADSDNDGLPDGWETSEFGNLAQTAAGDADNDGLSNAIEFDIATGANDPDTDDDGLNDGAEVNTHKTNSNVADSDGDGLLDAAEVNTHTTNPSSTDTDGDGLDDGSEILTHKTNPKVKDTDGDSVEDGLEISGGTDPIKADALQFTNVLVQSFSGADPGEGLDLDGKFQYAVNIAGPAAGKVRDATFTADNAPGVRMRAGAIILAWHSADYGDTPDENNLELVMRSIRHTPPVSLTFSNLVPSTTYKLQLLFAEQCCANRGFDVYADGRLLADEFNPSVVQGGAGNTSAGAVVSAEFVALRAQLTVVLNGATVTTEEFTDRNPIINGATLEIVKEGTAPIAARISQVRVDATGLVITFDSISGRKYTVEYKDALTPGPWEIAAENLTAAGASTVFTDSNAARRAKSLGFYRIRSL